jgi:hypothetical protein
MSGEGGSVDDRTVAEVAVSMCRLLAAVDAVDAVDAGELTSTPATRHWLAGAVAALERVATGHAAT